MDRRGKVLAVEVLLDKKGQMREWLEGGASLQGMHETGIPVNGRLEIKVSGGPFNPEVVVRVILWSTLGVATPVPPFNLSANAEALM